mgnify:CR=1 FL=1
MLQDRTCNRTSKGAGQHGRFKGENKRLFHEAANIWQLKRLIARQIEYYNCMRRHSTLGYTAPINYIIQKEILQQSVLGLALQRS